MSEMLDLNDTMNTNTETPSKKVGKIASTFFTILFVILMLFFGARVYVSTNYGGVAVDGASMRQTLQGGEWLLMELTSTGAKADYGDIIVVDVRSYSGSTAREGFLIKRLIAKGGDKLYCKQGRIFIRYKGAEEYVELDEPYAYYQTGKSLYNFASYEQPYEIQEGKIFYLGDNRQNSKDSEEEYASANGVIVNETDIHGVVPQWAITYQVPLRILFLTETYFKQEN